MLVQDALSAIRDGISISPKNGFLSLMNRLDDDSQQNSFHYIQDHVLTTSYANFFAVEEFSENCRHSGKLLKHAILS